MARAVPVPALLVLAALHPLAAGAAAASEDEREPASSPAEIRSATAADLLAELARADAAEEEALLRALGDLGRASVVPLVEKAAGGALPPAARRAALLGLGACAHRDELDLALDLAGAGEEEPRPDPLVQEGLERFAAALLARGPSAIPDLARALLHVHRRLAPPLVRAFGTEPSTERLRALGELLSYADDLDLVLLGEIGRAGARLPRPVDEDVRASVRRALDRGEERILREAALAAGRLADFGAVERLADLLEHPNDGVRASAHWALRETSGVDLHPDAGRWRAWARDERAWFEHGAPECFAALGGRDVRQVVVALGEVAAHRWEKAILAAEVGALLEHPSPRVRSRACDVLGRLGEAGVAPELRALLADPHADVAREARRALAALGEDPDAPAGGPGGGGS